MNDIELIDEYGPAATELSDEAWRAARTRLVSEIEGPVAAPARNRRWGLLPRIAIVGLAGIAAVAAAVAVLPGPHPSFRSPDVTAQQPRARLSFGPVRLVSVSAPQFPFGLPGLGEPSFTADPGGPVMGVFGDTVNDSVVLVPEPSAPQGGANGERTIEVDDRPATILSIPDGSGTTASVQLTWERRAGQWVTIVGNGRYASEEEVLRLARTVVDQPRPVKFKVTLGLAPEGWTLGGFKSDESSIAIQSYQERGSDREVHVVWYSAPQDLGEAEGFEARSEVTVAGRPATLTRATERWILDGTFPDGSAYHLMVPRDFTEAQVIELGESLRVH
ncbi:hypothetical protein [Actinoplanes sp. NPDC049802]|uniref:hypothetical protein n=1 Tax=Actinoplanes sp. NPDC049802 TaxID=3154742 RepID=UPI0033D9FD7E